MEQGPRPALDGLLALLDVAAFGDPALISSNGGPGNNVLIASADKLLQGLSIDLGAAFSLLVLGQGGSSLLLTLGLLGRLGSLNRRSNRSNHFGGKCGGFGHCSSPSLARD